jgi:hypothetical protein
MEELRLMKLRFQVVTATSMKMAVFWDVAPCSLIDTDRHFRGAYCLHHQGDEALMNKGLGECLDLRERK